MAGCNSPQARKMKATQKSLSRYSISGKKDECFLSLCCFLRCGFIFNLNPSEPTLMSVCSCPFLCHHQQSLVHGKTDQLADTAESSFVFFLFCCLHGHTATTANTGKSSAQSFLWMRGKDWIALFSSSYRLLG